MLVALFSVTAFAQKGKTFRPLGTLKAPTTIKAVDRHSQTASQVSRRGIGDELVTPPATATVETWYTTDGSFYVNTSSGFSNYTNLMPTVNVAIDGADIYIQGLAYWFKDAWVKGTIADGVASFASGQFVGEDEYGSEYIVASADGETPDETFSFTYSSEEGLLSSNTTYIVESGEAAELAAYCFWQNPVFSKEEPVKPEVVVAPEGLVAEEYVVFFTDYYEDAGSGYVNVGFDGSDVYVQGLCRYLPEAWVKGTLEGTTVTFAGGQFLGTYGSNYDMYLQDDDVVLVYDATANTFTLEGVITTYTGTYTADFYANPVIKKVVEMAGTPADPILGGIETTSGGDDVVSFAIPTVDTAGNPMASQKLAYQFFIDIETVESPLTFYAADYKNLEEDMTVIPYGFTEDYDFYNGTIYLNMEHSKWNRIGIQSIYTGGGEEHKSEVIWYTIKEYGAASFDFNAMDVTCSTLDDSAGDITEDLTLESGVVTLTVSPMTEGTKTPNRFWDSSKGPQLRVYSGTLTFEVPADRVITEMVFNAAKWNDGNTADTGAFEGTTWTGEARKVVVTIAGNTQLNSIDIMTAEFVPTPIEAPEGLETATYIFDAQAVEAGYEEEGPQPYTIQLQVGFDGDDAYIQGLAADDPELWAKATKNEAGQYVIPANQYMGTLEFWGYEFDYFFTAVDAEGNMVDAVFDYDAEAGKFSTAQTLVLNGALAELEPYMTFTDVTITKFVEVAATPANPAVESVGISGYGYPYADFDIPATGTNGEMLNTSKLFYTVWVEKDGEQKPYIFGADLYGKDFEEDVTEVPYDHDGFDIYAGGERVYFEEDEAEFTSWTKVGIQSIYYGAGEVRKSEVVWQESGVYSDPTGISSVEANSGKAAIFNLAGQRLSTPQKGLNIINGRKVMVK
jgi:hypothetical protein